MKHCGAGESRVLERIKCLLSAFLHHTHFLHQVVFSDLTREPSSLPLLRRQYQLQNAAVSFVKPGALCLYLSHRFLWLFCSFATLQKNLYFLVISSEEHTQGPALFLIDCPTTSLLLNCSQLWMWGTRSIPAEPDLETEKWYCGACGLLGGFAKFPGSEH